MGAIKLLDKEITEYLELLSVKQKQVLLSVAKTFARDEQPWWNDKTYMSEINRRFSEMESGKEKGFTLEEMEAGARLSYKKRKHKKI